MDKGYVRNTQWEEQLGFEAKDSELEGEVSLQFLIVILHVTDYLQQNTHIKLKFDIASLLLVQLQDH